MALKRDKDLEKNFKKEFHTNEIYFEVLTKLFKRRGAPSSNDRDVTEEDLNPFATQEKEQIGADSNPLPLVQAQDMPDGLGADQWAKLVDFRDKKLACESDIYLTTRYFKEMQMLVQNVLEESDNIKSEMEKTMSDLSQFLDYRFRNIYNIESLFILKQGQVEVPQAPIVTNYTDAVLLHRSVVENLNEQVKQLGGLKVDALKEMKDYRKGIHALEWYDNFPY